MKKYLFPIVYSVGIIIFGTLITSILYYFNITSMKINSIMLYLISVISVFTGSVLISKKSKQKGIITGLIYFMIFFILSLIITFSITKVKFQLSSLFYYLILLVFSILGGIIGKNSNQETDI